MKPRMKAAAAALAWVALALLLTGCVRGCPSSRPPIHINPNMDDQPRYDALEASKFFYDGKVQREPVPGTVARGELREDGAFFTGKDEAGDYLSGSPVEATEAVLARGEQRFDIYCAPCHEKRGTGRGILFQYGSVPTPSFHEQRIIDLPDGQIFETITNGKGLMKGYGYPIPPADRWAIVAHLRRLQHERQDQQLALAGGAP